MEQYTIFSWWSRLVWVINTFNPLIVWNNPFGVDVPYTEKPEVLLAQAGTENCPIVNF